MTEKTFLPFTKKRKLGYAFCIFTDSLVYSMFYTYFLTFLVQIAGIKPAVSGIVIFVSLIWDAVTDPIIGAYTDRAGVDKRVVMKRAIVPLAIVFAASWANWGRIIGSCSVPMLVIIYIVLSMCIWLFYTFYTIPYYAVVVEITEDYDERTSIRGLSSLLNAASVIFGSAFPALVSTVIFSHTVTYFDIAVVLAVLALGTGFIAVASLRGIYLKKAEQPKLPMRRAAAVADVFRGFRQISRLCPFRHFLLFTFCTLFALGMIQSNFAYSVVYCMKMDYDTGIVIVIGTLTVAMAIFAPVSEKLAHRTDRRTSAMICLAFCFVGLMLIYFLGLDFTVGSFKIMLILLPLFVGAALGSFWTLFYPMAYDFVELDEYINGVRRESLVTSFPQFVQKIGSGFGILMQGVLLTAYGYVRTNADYSNIFEEVSDPTVIRGMTNITTLFPAILVALAILGLALLPTTRKRMDLLMRKLEAKRNGLEVTDEGLERLL